ncbi:uncharacterized protein LOC122935520 [Bufo gargarizans]|uniref:uncharacterized protein LOC122935520 n=1 Tax=Bufo gargarizans TaxID=30331 RepID=UPI001CF46409|nr:uncharacterized protein LOC122935520 [Bufo gargarizans]XP_044147230.1 uncharacterized protein LOC122935520 [Bufo gargarizans]XP_044147237.1 uncharacterized protein LOC122935520 [Bufo gargarizans]
MSSMHSSEFLQAGKLVRRSTAGTHLSIGPGNHGKLLLKGDGQTEFQSLASSRRSSGNEQKLAKLQEENDQLRQELEDLRFQYRQLIDEGKNQCLDERRVNLLKSQVLQLERQVMLLTEGLSSRASVLLELGDALQAVLDKMQSLLTSENRTPEVQVTRVELIRMIEICQSMQDKLRRNHQTSSVENLSVPWLMSGRQATKNPVTLLDLCYGKVDNLNLLYVSALEGKLSTLFRHLHAARQTLSIILAPGAESSESAHHILPTVTYSRLINHLTRCNQSLEECCTDLLTITLIVPSAPWAKIECSASQEFTVENVLAVLPAFPKGAPQQRAKRAAEALVKATNYSRLMAMQQIHALEAELDFHRGIYNLQVQYTQALFQGIKQAYHNFQENVVAVVCSPLKDVLSSYADLKTKSSETSLRNFLTIFKNNAEQIQEAVDTLTPSTAQQHEGEEAFSKLGKEFFISLDNSLKNCREERDRSIFEIEKLRQELNQALDTMKTLKMERKHKGSSSNEHSSKSEGDSADGKTKESVDHARDITNITSQLFAFGRRNSLTSTAKEKEIQEIQPQQNQTSSPVRHRSKSLQRSKSVRMRPSWQV